MKGLFQFLAGSIHKIKQAGVQNARSCVIDEVSQGNVEATVQEMTVQIQCLLLF